MDLSEVRKKIDAIDFELLKLLNTRMEYALRAKNLKKQVTDQKRESEVIEYIQRHSQGLIEPEFCKRLFSKIIKESKRLQLEELRLAGFRGEHGEFAEMAARDFDPNLICISCAEFREVIESVQAGLLHFGIVPVEHTHGGAVPEMNEFLGDTDLQITGEVKLPVRYHLLAPAGTDPREIRVVYAHRHTLSQCQKYLTEHELEGRPYYDNGAAAKMLLRERPKGSAAIGSPYAAEFYNLQVLAEGIEDYPGSLTRFLILSTEGGRQEGNKCSIVFGTRNKAGALFTVLKEFADEAINLTRIESLPNRRDPEGYLFFVDFQGSIREESVLRALDRVKAHAPFYKFLGCYPQAESRRRK